MPEDPAVTDVSAAEALETPTQPATDPLPTEQSPESDPVAEPAASAPDPTPESAPLQSEASPPTPIAEPAFVDFPAGTDDELAPIAERSAEEIVVDYQRRGGFVSLSGGVGHCGAECSDLPAIGGARFEGGYRWGHLAIGASVSIAGAKFSTAESEEGDFYRTSEADGRIQFFQMSPFAQLFFASSGRFDPYVQAGFGYHHFLRQSDIRRGSGSLRWKYWSPSPGATLGSIWL
ncbi:MAG: hypothetical protein KUG77_15715, partial [Nannocystaceae bacterium]|nr:hypothetical protein [Nannocystaceae bacterium]